MFTFSWSKQNCFSVGAMRAINAAFNHSHERWDNPLQRDERRCGHQFRAALWKAMWGALKEMGVFWTLGKPSLDLGQRRKPGRSRCWTPTRRWAWPWWSAAGRAPTAAGPAPPWGSCDTGDRSGGTGPDWCSPCGPRRPCAWPPCLAGWRCRRGRLAFGAPCRAPPTPLKASYLRQDGQKDIH